MRRLFYSGLINSTIYALGRLDDGGGGDSTNTVNETSTDDTGAAAA